jgi:hypothetical protein
MSGVPTPQPISPGQAPTPVPVPPPPPAEPAQPAGSASSTTLINEPVGSASAETKATSASAVTEYKDFTLPKDVKLDEAVLAEFKTVAKQAGLTQEAAQSLMNLHAKVVQATETAAATEFANTNKTWMDTVKADPEIGGAKFDAMRVTVGKGLDAIFPNDPGGARAFREALDFTGAGNNPAVVRGIFRLAKAIVEAGHVSGAPPTGQKPTLAQAMWPSQAQGPNQ